MKRAALGIRMHSGWGALVAVSSSSDTVEILDRRRIAVIASGALGAMQPYHFAKNLELAEAEKFIANCFAVSTGLALQAVQSAVDALCARQYRVVSSAVVLASGRPLPPISEILAAHPLIHTAEGEFFRAVFWKACAELALPVTGIRERDLEERAQTTFGKTAGRMQKQLSTLGRALGPPWTTDQKTAALAALVVLATSESASTGGRHTPPR
jgi:hypothetical protein